MFSLPAFLSGIMGLSYSTWGQGDLVSIPIASVSHIMTLAIPLVNTLITLASHIRTLVIPHH